MSQLEGLVVKGQEHKVCKLIKSLYGLKQEPRAWYKKLTKHLLKLNFEHYDLDDATYRCRTCRIQGTSHIYTCPIT